MKKISNDNSIVETVKKTNQYKIKTSANDILQAFEKEKSESKAKGKTKKKIIFGAIGSSLLASGAICGIVFSVLNSQNNTTLKPEEVVEYFSPTSNESLKKQLITFSGFKGNFSSETINNKITLNSINNRNDFEDDDEDDDENNLLEEDFNEIVDQFDIVQDTIRTVFDVDKYSIIEKSVDFSYQDRNYDILNQCVSDNNKELFSLYLNSKDMIAKDNDNLFFYSGLYCVGNDYYLSKFKEEKVKYDNQFSVEVIMERITEGVEDKHIYVMKKESEYKSQKSENCYSFSIYANLNELHKEQNALFFSELEYKNKDNHLEMELFIKNRINTFEFEDIYKHDESTISFILNEAKFNRKKISDIEFLLKYIEENRIYSALDFETTRN